ncbi:cobalt ECF transporter T component CbiQ [Streptomyces sp. NPDC005438]|uniref:cobalt ECF transporter T component CbiQ n=1 Tax=Streptomyces sp. NPDC005438 TaxID=3156880 RepID=UPI0033BADF65
MSLYLPGDSVVHRLPAHCKTVAVVGFVLAVVATPREALWVFGGYALLVALVVRSARLPFRVLARRLLVELPFVAFALLLPWVAEGPRVHWWGLSLSGPGLWAAWNILAKGTLGVAASQVLAATTPVPELLRGLRTLRLPALLVEIAGFMVRYLQVVTEEMRRMRVARLSRGFTARGVRSWGVLAKSAAALFLRAYERGERVHLAMLSRGYRGAMPHWDTARATRRQWLTSAVPPLAATLLCLWGWLG